MSPEQLKKRRNDQVATARELRTILDNHTSRKNRLSDDVYLVHATNYEYHSEELKRIDDIAVFRSAFKRDPRSLAEFHSFIRESMPYMPHWNLTYAHAYGK
jgi:hypothetical protein